MTLKVMLVDDHALFMEGLQYLLKTHDIEVLGCINDSRDALEQARRLKPDIILMDIKMPNCNGLELLRLIKTELRSIRIVMLTTSDEDEDLFETIKAGASGYLLKNTNAEELVTMLSNLEKGETPLSPCLAGRLYNEFRRRDAHEADANRQSDSAEGLLSQRQLEVIAMVAEGKTYKEVGAALGLTERTVKYHMGRIVEQLHLEKSAQAIAYAARIGFIDYR